MIRLDWDDRVAVLVVDRPERRNALDVEHCLAARRAVEDAVAGGARALVLAGEGPAFCAGADLTDSYDADSDDPDSDNPDSDDPDSDDPDSADADSDDPGAEAR